MLTVYIASFVFGGILLFASLFVGDLDSDAGDLGADADVDLGSFDAHLDVGHAPAPESLVADATEGASSLLFLKVRFWIFALAFFGLAGTLLMATAVVADGVRALAVAVPVALVTAYGATLLFERVRRQESGHLVQASSYVGRTGKVTLPIAPGQRGLVRLVVQGSVFEMAARAEGEATIAAGREVRVVAVEGPLVVVTNAE